MLKNCTKMLLLVSIIGVAGSNLPLTNKTFLKNAEAHPNVQKVAICGEDRVWCTEITNDFRGVSTLEVHKRRRELIQREQMRAHGLETNN